MRWFSRLLLVFGALAGVLGVDHLDGEAPADRPVIERLRRRIGL